MRSIVIAVILSFIPIIAYSQIDMCIEKVPISNSLTGAKNHVFHEDHKWDNGAVLNVKFKNGSPLFHSKVKQYAAIWEQYANIHFNYDQNASPSILIEFVDDNICWSQIGRNSLKYAQNGQASMHYGIFNEYTDEITFRRKILHEFGHALGLDHEHQCPTNTIKWNKPVVYNFYYRACGWTPEQVDRQVLNRLSVTLSNGTYDPASIMHYPISPELTEDGFTVPWNTELSPGDIKIISEKYPRILVPITGNAPAPTAEAKQSAVLDSFAIRHNTVRDGIKGIEVSTYFRIWNAQGKICKASIFFYDADSKPIPGKSRDHRSSTGGAYTKKSFTPTYQNSRFGNFTLFLPYDELIAGDGDTKMKFLIVLRTEAGEELTRSPFNSFTLHRGPFCDNIDIRLSVNKSQKMLSIIPKFSVHNAINYNCVVRVYFIDENDNLLRKENGDLLSYQKNIIPATDPAAYNSRFFSDLDMCIPYSDVLPFLYRHKGSIELFVALFSDGRQFATSYRRKLTIDVLNGKWR